MEVTSKSLIRSAGLGEPWGGDPEMASMGPRPREAKREDFGRVVGYGKCDQTKTGQAHRPGDLRASSIHSPDSSADGIMIVKMKKGQELKVRCIARKVRPNGAFGSSITLNAHPSCAILDTRVSQKSMPSGHQCRPLASSTILAIVCDIRLFGTKATRRENGLCPRMP